MSFPLRYSVGHRTFQPGAANAHGDPVESWSAAVPKKVFGWGSPSTSEPRLAGHNRDVVDVELLVPAGFVCGHRDRMVLGGVEFEVVGEPEMSDHNPFGWNPGGVVNLRKVDG